ncbi:hypothetical protein KIW84_033632 [Lathyrus oleraceus]|uniref:Uncharacterized protein n=1 Tax=Pisum sativum TaxID=3888 RepID=A0A9D4Y0M8_PEA|nr:hypothetical protein KIW84_033632 [Pisum sativum]
MASSKSFIISLLFVVTMSSINVGARSLLQTTTLPHPTIPSLPKSSLPDLSDLSVIPSFPKGSLLPLHTSIPSLPKYTMPPFYNFPSTEPSFSISPVSSPTPTLVPSTLESTHSFFSFFPFFSQTLSIHKP